MSDHTTVQEQYQHMMVAESVAAGGIPSQNPNNDGLISVLPADNVLPVSQHEPQLAGGGKQVSGGNRNTMAEEDSLMATEMDEDPTR
jgi:hypothetical protein